jgi:hypothetical protein
MLWSQFSAIFANFRRKIWRSSQKPMLWSHFFPKLTVVWAKNAKFFAKFFGENIFKIITSVPVSRHPWTTLTSILPTASRCPRWASRTRTFELRPAACSDSDRIYKLMRSCRTGPMTYFKMNSLICGICELVNKTFLKKCLFFNLLFVNIYGHFSKCLIWEN